jgi:hypothetical protein
LWERLGYVSQLALIADLGEIQERAIGWDRTSRRRRGRPPHSSDGRGRHRQVNIKLAPDDYERLRRVAKGIGLMPSTFARMLVVRAARELDANRGPGG